LGTQTLPPWTWLHFQKEKEKGAIGNWRLSIYGSNLGNFDTNYIIFKNVEIFKLKFFHNPKFCEGNF
jgi:hypothetical protein